MTLGIAVMGIIILITLAVMLAVMYFGSQHDPHNEIRSAESSRSVQVLQQQAAAAVHKYQSAPVGVAAAISASGEVIAGNSEEDPSQLGDDETRNKRREAALARKAARQQQSVSGTSEESS